MGLKISKNGIELIKFFEGCPKNKKGQIESYKDIGGVWTIGYGWTGKVNGKPITKGLIISQKQADELLLNNIKDFEDKVNKYYKTYKWNQNQFDALVSFCWNIGSITKLTSNGTRTIKEISNAMISFNKVNGKEVKGLTNRRKKEKELFDKPVKSTSDSSVKYVKVNTNGGNLLCREKAIIDSKVIGKFSNCTKLTLIEKTNSKYWKVRGKSINGLMISGYCSTTYLK